MDKKLLELIDRIAEQVQEEVANDQDFPVPNAIFIDNCTKERTEIYIPDILNLPRLSDKK